MADKERTKKIVIYPGVSPFEAARCLEDYLATDRPDKEGSASWVMYQKENRLTGEVLGYTCQIYATKTQIVVKP